ncbi:MAG TPA: biotin--[acetyl-CoA-carboxylase] ligase [Syntrophorhabdaceae bacterium]|nr:Bifunctional ligase/repressor BirA [Syntrophorhabdaceae bacterium]HNZ59563.1 biotin--[acetyl-CoA-carboxylase] ligase [Syntrophorhabdaceae bacterium]HOB69847.1 biotin--[acetyl-CoA-carboxylase] ligase [Syntrophorhabdaceae bacterium]HQJ95089.1 biotin--[acetyl-CoA-carboxylase] ligase [Syntrophorhabdaceae bacterium]
MDRMSEILRFLRDANDYISGDTISTELGISRTAVWKYINQLEKKGYGISKLKGKGYSLVNIPDKLFPWEINRYLHNSFTKEIIYKETIDSTNTYAFKLALTGKPEGTCIVAESQKSGKGRLNRTWFSPAYQNIYLSVILRPPVHPSKVYPITFLSSLAVHDTVKDLTGLPPTLKWPNDVLINGKKVCGTLLEISTEADMVSFVIIGIGFNINMDAQHTDESIKDKATSLYMETGKTYNRAYVCAVLLSMLERYYSVFLEKGEREICNIWESKALIKGKYIEINQMTEVFRGISEGIDIDGAMLLNINGEVKKIIAGDVLF